MLFIFNLAKRLQLILLALVVGVAGVAFLSNPAAAETYTVKMGSDKAQLIFDPPSLTINQGDTVRWVNNKVYPHNVVFDKVPGGDAALAAKLSHKALLTAPNQVVESAFVDVPPGEYTYYCTPHRGAGMVGKIIVNG
ncbi:plastocyanin [Synechococcus sp. H60.3]|uniref:plastocyanin n=1 Tax=unclassified Synechococcus TaxID=2626047 RepID=UPI0039C0647C